MLGRGTFLIGLLFWFSTSAWADVYTCNQAPPSTGMDLSTWANQVFTNHPGTGTITEMVSAIQVTDDHGNVLCEMVWTDSKSEQQKGCAGGEPEGSFTNQYCWAGGNAGGSWQNTLCNSPPCVMDNDVLRIVPNHKQTILEWLFNYRSRS